MTDALPRLPLRAAAPALPAAVLAVGAWHAHRSLPLTIRGDVYTHVAGHLVSAGSALAVAVAAWSLRSTARSTAAITAARVLVAGWLVLTVGMGLDAVGGTWADGDNPVHASAVPVLVVGVAVALAGHAAVGVTCTGLPVAVRLGLVGTLPAWMMLVQAGSDVAVALAAVAGASWLLACPAVLRAGVSPARRTRRGRQAAGQAAEREPAPARR